MHLDRFNRVLKWTIFILATISVTFGLVIPLLLQIYLPLFGINLEESGLLGYMQEVSVVVSFLSFAFAIISMAQTSKSGSDVQKKFDEAVSAVNEVVSAVNEVKQGQKNLEELFLNREPVIRGNESRAIRKKDWKQEPVDDVKTGPEE